MSSSCKAIADPEIAGLRLWISVFFLLGLLLSLTTSLTVAWQYHIGTDPRLIGQHFLFLNVGFITASVSARSLLKRFAIRTLAIFGCGVAVAGLLGMAFATPPAAPIWRLTGFLVLGLSSGTIFSATLHALREAYQSQPVPTVTTRSGFLFGLGCAASTVTIGATYFAGSVALEVGLLALVPLAFLLAFLCNGYRPARQPFRASREEELRRTAMRDLRTVAAFLFSALLFFQFGNEWVVAGWLALFIIQRLGASPVDATLILAIHFGAVTLGRVLAPRYLAGWPRRRVLAAGLLAAMAGYAVLSLAANLWICGVGATLIALGYAPIFPAIAEILDYRFAFHPGFYQTIFSIAITGAMATPWLAGFIDHAFGIRFVMLLPVLGTLAVAALIMLIRLEAHLMQDEKPKAAAAHG